MRISIAFKIFGIALTLLVLLAIAAAFSTVNVRRVANEVESIGHYFTPLSQAAGRIQIRQLQQALIGIRLALHKQLVVGVSSPYPKLATFSRELLKHWEALFTFARLEGVEPTNNAAERALRHAVLWRKGSFGSRSEEGCRFVERLLSVRATCVQQGRNLFDFLTEAVDAAWAGRSAPLLVQVLQNA